MPYLEIAGRMIEQEPLVPHQWDIETDVVVAMFGAAGFAASVTAHDLGAKAVRAAGEGTAHPDPLRDASPAADLA